MRACTFLEGHYSAYHRVRTVLQEERKQQVKGQDRKELVPHRTSSREEDPQAAAEKGRTAGDDTMHLFIRAPFSPFDLLYNFRISFEF